MDVDFGGTSAHKKPPRYAAVHGACVALLTSFSSKPSATASRKKDAIDVSYQCELHVSNTISLSTTAAYSISTYLFIL